MIWSASVLTTRLALSGGVVHAAASARRGSSFFQLGPAFGKADLGEPEEDQAEHRQRVLPRGEAGIGAELIGGGPKALFERVIRGAFSDGASHCIEFGQADEGANASVKWYRGIPLAISDSCGDGRRRSQAVNEKGGPENGTRQKPFRTPPARCASRAASSRGLPAPPISFFSRLQPGTLSPTIPSLAPAAPTGTRSRRGCSAWSR